MSIIRKKDLHVLNDKIGDIKNEAKKIAATTMDPTVSEFNAVSKIILDYIKKNERILSGGFALNMLIDDLDKKLYDEYDMPDIDFYSHDPVNDLKNICNLIYSKGYTNVIGKEAQHIDSYKIYVNYQNYSDMTYVPKHLLNTFPVVKKNGFKIISPLMMLIDKLRMMTNPMNDYWRLEKEINRTALLQSLFPVKTLVNFKYKKDNYKFPKPDKKLNIKLLNFMNEINDDTAVICGDIISNFYIKEKFNIKKRLCIITENYDKYIEFVYDNVDKEQIKHYYPFFQYWEKRTELFEGSIIIIRNENKCIPYINFDYDGKQLHFACFDYTLMYNLMTYIYYKSYNNDNIAEHCYKKNKKMIKAKNKYLIKNSLNAFDESIYRSLIVKCLGKTINQTKEFLMKIEKRRQKGKRSMFSFDPKNDKNQNVSNYIFKNISGNINKEPKKTKTFRNKK